MIIEWGVKAEKQNLRKMTRRISLNLEFRKSQILNLENYLIILCLMFIYCK